MKVQLFFFVFLAVMALLNLYVWRRFFTPLHFINLRRAGLLICLLLFFLQMLFVWQAATQGSFPLTFMSHLTSASIGITFLLFVTALLYDVLHSTAKKVPFDSSRRLFIKILFDVTMLILALSYMLKGIAGGLKSPVLNRINVPIKGLNKPLLIVQISDLHVGRTIGKDFVNECVERINAVNADMIVLTGDLVDGRIEQIKEALQPLAKLQSRYGTFFVTGNHEYFHGVEAICAHLKTLGIDVLLNENRKILHDGAIVQLVGINDIISQRIGVMPCDVEAAFADTDPALPTVVLSHQPKSTLLMQQQKYDLMLSGHTHGGQIFPFGLLVMLDQPYLAGLYAIDARKKIFVSRGAGYWGPPVRVFAPSEISIIALQKG